MQVREEMDKQENNISEPDFKTTSNVERIERSHWKDIKYKNTKVKVKKWELMIKSMLVT
jgi:hypothetical protein